MAFLPDVLRDAEASFSFDAAAAAPDAHGFHTLGAVTAVERAGAAVVLHCGAARLRLDVLSDDALRVRLAPPGGSFGPDETYALDPSADWPGPSRLDVEETDEAVTLRTTALHVAVRRDACRLAVLDRDGQPLVEDEAGAAWQSVGHNGSSTTRVALGLRLRPAERLFGLGDKPLALDRRGALLENWNTDAFRYQRGSDPLYKSVPFLLGLHDGRAYGLFFDNTFRTRFDLGAADEGRLRIEADGPPLDYTVFAGETPLDVVRAFARRTGRTPMLPRWALGYHQCRYSYLDEGEVREVAAEFRARKIPCDVLYFDIHYMDGFRVFTWDRSAFPEPDRLVEDLAADGFRSVVIVDPGVKADDPAYAVHRDGLEKGVFCPYPDGRPFAGEVWPGLCHFPDFTRADVRRWWGEQHEGYVRQGVAGVWNDMNEPAVFTVPGEEAHASTFPPEVRHDFDGRGASHAEAHNVYGMQMARATYDGLRRLAPTRRPFVITRAAYAGTQRFSTAWTGDNSSTWDHLKLAVQQCLALGASGVPFVGADVGGFVGAPDGELLARWTQLGALTPLFRNHSAIDTPRQEPWVFGPEVERVCREAIELRYRLLPYLYTALREAATDGTPILRALPLVHPEDETVRRTSPDGFYVGPDLLAHPVLEPGQRSREVYLPASESGWYCFHTGEFFPGRSTVWVQTPLDALPLFVRAGSVVALQPVLQHTSERPVERPTLHIYPAPGRFFSLLYDDAGDGWAFEEGAYWLGRFTGEDDGAAVRVACAAEGRFAPPWTSWEVVVHGLPQPPRAVVVDGGVIPAAVPFTHDSAAARFVVPVGAQFEVRR